MPHVSFGKYEGLGNDFVLIEDVAITPECAARLCDRRRGIGADGVLTLYPSTQADVRMHVFNADGSEAEMCGNGLRCVVRSLGKNVRVETGAGVLAGSIEGDRVRVELGAARSLGSFEVQLDDQIVQAPGISMGNPHLVLPPLTSDTDLRALAQRLGPRLEHHPAFPDRTNVEFVKRIADGLELVVFERGSGITDACGTGAGATAVALGETDVKIRLPGGWLRVLVEADQVSIEGPAEHVFDGSVDLADAELR